VIPRTLQTAIVFVFATTPIPAPGSIQPHTQWVPGSPSPMAKRPERESYLSPPFNAEV